MKNKLTKKEIKEQGSKMYVASGYMILAGIISLGVIVVAIMIAALSDTETPELTIMMTLMMALKDNAFSNVIIGITYVGVICGGIGVFLYFAGLHYVGLALSGVDEEKDSADKEPTEEEPSSKETSVLNSEDLS